MQHRQTPVERRQPRRVAAGLLGEVRIGDLSWTDHSGEPDVAVSEVVDPELMSWLGSDSGEQGDCIRSGAPVVEENRGNQVALR